MSVLTDWYKVKVTFVCVKTSNYTDTPVKSHICPSLHCSGLTY